MARRVHPLLRLALLAFALGALATAWAQLARAEDAAGGEAGVTIVPPGGGTPRTLTLAGLPLDVHDATYTLRAGDGSTSSVTVAAGTSVAELLRAADVDPDDFTYAEISEASGAGAVLLRAQLGGRTEGPPVVWSDEQGVHFLRPSDGEEDQNASDLLTAADGSLTLAFHRDAQLVPRMRIWVRRPRPHQPVRFSATLTLGEMPRGMDFQWYFDGHGAASGAEVVRRFPRAERVYVILSVGRSVSDTVGATDAEYVRIVRPRARDHGSVQPPQDARAQDGDGGRPAGGTTGSGGTNGSSGNAGGGAGPPRRTAPSQRPQRRVSVPPPVASRDPIVSGTLLAAADVGPVVAPSGARGTMSATRDAEPDAPLDVPVGAWVAFGLAALLAVGWALESRHTIPFWQP